MKREFIKELLPDITKDALDAIMTENGKDIETHKNTIATLTTARDGLQTQLNDANTAIKSYKDMDVDGIKKAAGDWETKYTTETQALKDQLAAKDYEYAVKDSVGAFKFTSESAKRAFIADLNGKKLPIQEGKLLGLDDFAKTYKTSDPDAFAPEGDDKTPVATRGAGGGGAAAPNAAMRAAMGLPPQTKS